MYFAYHVLKEKTKSVLVAWRKCPEWNKLAWELYSCVHMVGRDMAMQDVEEHISVKGICK